MTYNLLLWCLSALAMMFGMSDIYAETATLNSNAPEMALGMMPERSPIGVDILRALRSSIFLAFGIFCFKALKQLHRFSMMQVGALIMAALISYNTAHSNHHIGAPDFTYFSITSFIFVSLYIFCSFEYLRTNLVTQHKISLFDNLIMALAILAISMITIMSVKSPQFASNSLLLVWGALVIMGVGRAIYLIVEKKSQLDLVLLGWVPTQIGLVIALGIGTDGSSLSVMTSIASWTCVIIGHAFLAYLTYMRASAGAQNVPHGSIHTAYGVQAKSDQGNSQPDPVQFIIDKAVFRLQADRKKIIINEVGMSLLYLSGHQNDYTIEAFKGLIEPKYHNIVDQMIENNLSAPAYIKFHVCEQKGFIQPLQCQMYSGATDILFLYQGAPQIHLESSDYTSDTQQVSMDTENMPQYVSASMFEDDGIPLRNQQSYDIKVDRRQSSEMMSFIQNTAKLIEEHHFKSGNFALILLQVKYHDDWQIILGLTQAFDLMRKVTQLIEETLAGFDSLYVKSFNGELIGVFCHIVDAHEAEIERIKSVITKKFKTPIRLDEYKIFVNFNQSYIKISVQELNKDFTPRFISHKITMAVDSVCRDIALHREVTSYDKRKLLLPEGSDLISLSSDLRYAPERDQIHAYYAPIISLQNGKIIGFNVDPIWRHPDYDIIDGDLLAHLTHRCQMENTLSRLILAKSMDSMIKLYRSGNMPIMNFVVSKNRLMRAKLDEEIDTLCRTLNIPASLIRLEFSSDHLVDNSKWFASVLKDLKSMGISTVLNDFGASKGQLAALSNLAFDRVVIDSAFAHDILHNERHFFTLQSLTSMLKNISIETDIKNVTSSDCIQKLNEAGISNISGSAIGKLMPVERAMHLMRQNYETQ